MGSKTRRWPEAAPIDALDREAALLAEAASRYFDHDGRADCARLDPADRVIFSCEALRIRTRLLDISAWLVTCRDVMTADRDAAPCHPARHRLAELSAGDGGAIGRLPTAAQMLIGASIDLHDRIRRLDRGDDEDDGRRLSVGPARRLIERLQQAF
ncbi:regulator of CtrA degradation [Sphingomonas zeicaulis]|uniref:DUF1465 family protein n=1 Tax=Sphingomonas zeicaulis TaxID=1632740 RepID=UPI003D1F41A1